MSPQDTQDLMPRNAALEDVFPKANLGIYQIFHLINLNLMKDWKYTRVYEPLGYISGSKAKVLGMVMSSFLQSAFYPGPRGQSNTKNIASPLPVKTTDQGFCHNIAEKHGYVCLLTQKCVVSIKISNK